MPQTSSSPPTPQHLVKRLEINQRQLKRTLTDFINLSISDSCENVLEIDERPVKRPLLDFGKLSISDSSQNVGTDSETNMAKSSSAEPPSKHVFVRLKRKPFQSPLDALWLEIKERPLKRPLLDFGNLSISNSSQNVEFHDKKVLVQHVKTISSSEVTLDIVRSFVKPGSKCAFKSKSEVEERKNFKKVNKSDQLLFKGKQEKESSANDAHFKQIWRRRAEENKLREICQFYDIVRVDHEEKIKEVQQEDISLEDQRLLSNFIPLLIDVIPKAAAEIEADTSVHSKQEDYVYDLYTVTDETIIEEKSSYSYPLIQVDDEDFYDGPDNSGSDYETDDSNAKYNFVNDDHPAKFSEEEGSVFESGKKMHDSTNDELIYDEDLDDELWRI